MRVLRFDVFAAFALMIFYAPQLFAQSNAASQGTGAKATGVIPAVNHSRQYLWTEEFSGSTSSDGQVMELDSTAGYVFSRYLGVDAGIPLFFVRNSSTNSSGVTTTTSNNGIGDVFAQLRLTLPTPVIHYKTVLTGTAPTGSVSSGLSTGHTTYDWTNHVDLPVAGWTPFVDAGLGNSIPANFVFRRPYESYGHLAHFQAGVGRDLAGWLSVSGSVYDIAPWGAQTITSRVVGKGAAPVGTGGHGRSFELSNQTTGGSSLSADNGFNAEADFSTGSIVDFSASYSYSTHFQLSTLSFGVSLNMSQLLRGAHAGGL